MTFRRVWATFADKLNTTRAMDSNLIRKVVDELSDPSNLHGLLCRRHEHAPLPSAAALRDIVELCRGILFPGYFGYSKVSPDTLAYHMGVDIERLQSLLKKQVLAGLCFVGSDNDEKELPVADIRGEAERITLQVIEKLPALRSVLATDVEAAMLGDPAAMSHGEIIACYPVMRALTNYRLAHELHLLGVPLIPRMLTELAHSETGIDIHPAATIGHHFTIDHGTGVVIGATCIIGDYVKLYQGVTLGALSFKLDKDGNPVKNIPRHPIIGDHVIIYSNATVLGRIHIGDNCVIGANRWVSDNVPANTKVYRNVNVFKGFMDGSGI